MPILDTDETHEIVASWEIVRQDPVENGLKFFQYLFLKHPDVHQEFFPHMNPNDDASIRIHGARVVTSTLMEYLNKELGPHLTEEGTAAWAKLLSTLVAVVGGEVEKLDGSQCLGGNACTIS